ncbi:MAG: CDP-alcohol phosphatidyltransferase family protein, partial [Deltaproteobacteria bacterium]|nr:CDP-alcohol phosphatidyltransferase family protein [Deltaproteobacteria bacterium]
MNIPNILTLLRILLTPLFVIFLLKHLYSFALIVFTLAGISDGLDGFIARYLNQRTTLGAYLDPIADKLLVTAAYVSLAILNIIPPWL